jgi:hypothetical protein
MARATSSTIEALRKAANQLEKSNDYQWGHMGSCNCGFLAQQITKQKKSDIHTKAMEKHGDWSEQLNDYCPSSGLNFDELISELISFGFDIDDLKHLERLSDGSILRKIPINKRNLVHNQKEDVLLYLRTWATILESELLGSIKLTDLTHIANHSCVKV